MTLVSAHESKRYLGLELAGAKNQKTSLAVLEFFPREKKIFLLEVYEKIGAVREGSGTKPTLITGDESLLQLLNELRQGASKMGVNIPLDLPPCMGCSRKVCPLPSKCTVPEVKWMRDFTRKQSRGRDSDHRVYEFTPYTQRPMEIWARYRILSKLTEFDRLEVDEAFGGNKAPLAARMNFLKRHLSWIDLVEVWPKITVAFLAKQLGLNKRVISRYRQLESGNHAREEILDSLAETQGVFIYERDIRKLASNLAAFDAFVCAYTALISDLDQCVKPPLGFPTSSEWLRYPSC